MRTRPLGTEFSPAEAATVARFDAAPDAEESLRERVAVAIWEADNPSLVDRWSEYDFEHWNYRRMADAAIAVMRGDS